MLLNDRRLGVHSSNKCRGKPEHTICSRDQEKKSLVSTRGSPAQQLWATLTEDRSEIGPETEFHNLHVSKKLYWAISAIPTLNKVQSAWHMHHCPLPASNTPEVKQEPSWPPYKWEGGLYLLSYSMPLYRQVLCPKIICLNTHIPVPFCNQNHRWS